MQNSLAAANDFQGVPQLLAGSFQRHPLLLAIRASLDRKCVAMISKKQSEVTIMSILLSRCFVSSILLVFSWSCAAQTVEIKRIPIKYVSAASGKKMYVAYCAACHAKDGKGNGPAARALSAHPADLTVLAQRNSGKFPESHVHYKILGDLRMSAHNEKDMPVWGDLFLALSDTPWGSTEVHQRAFVLTKYLASLQQ